MSRKIQPGPIPARYQTSGLRPRVKTKRRNLPATNNIYGMFRVGIAYTAAVAYAAIRAAETSRLEFESGVQAPVRAVRCEETQVKIFRHAL